MPKAIILEQTGAPEVMQWRDVPMPKCGPKELLIKQTAVGLNYIDTYHRSGLYPMELPGTPGLEGAGEVIEAGSECEFFKPGDKICYAGGPIGAYAQFRTIPERNVVKIPDGISDQLAAGIMLKGLTAHYLIKRTYVVNKDTVVLIHAAAGGVGLLLCQWARHLGATVIGTVGSAEKAELALANGCHYAVNYKEESFVEKVKQVTEGRGVHVVYDSVGQATFEDSLKSLMPMGLMISFGQSSGPIAPFDMSVLQKHGSIFLTRPSLMDYIADHASYLVGCTNLMQLVLEGVLKINVKQSFYLSDAVRAHHKLEERQTTGATIFVVDE